MNFDFEKHLVETQRLAQVGTWEWDVSNDTVIWSEEHYRIFGLRSDTFTPSLRTGLTYVHPDDRVAVRTAVERAILDRLPFQREYRVIRPDGEVRTVLALGAWSRVAGEQTRLCGTVQDITDRKQIEGALRESENRLRVLLDEREHFARDLHDKLLQDLYAIGLNLESVQRMPLTGAAEFDAVIGKTILTLNGAINAARHLVEGAPASEVDIEQELQTIARFAEGVRQVSAVATLDHQALDRIPSRARADVVNIVREAVSNSLRHSAASTIAISIERHGTGVRLKIEDNGRGFDSRRRQHAGQGLRNMASRARAIGGKLRVQVRSPDGTRVTLEIPGTAVQVSGIGGR